LKIAIFAVHQHVVEKPRFWEGVAASEQWQKDQRRIELRADDLVIRSDRLDFLAKGVNTFGRPRIHELAVAKVRCLQPELAAERDRLIVEQHKAFIEQSLQLQQQRSHGRSLSLGS
jgi:hypothetical protein